MAIKTSSKWLCGYCKKEYSSQIDADNCKSSHNLLYIPISREDLGRLIAFIYRGEEQLIPPGLVELLQGYLEKSRIVDKTKET